jgi:hypothetical protein
LAVVSHFSEEKVDPVYKDRHLLGLEQCPEELEELQKRLRLPELEFPLVCSGYRGVMMMMMMLQEAS